MEATIFPEQILGIKKKMRTPFDFMTAAKDGIGKKEITRLAEKMCVPIRVIAQLLLIHERTIRRHPEDKAFDLATSERAIRLAQVTARGIEVFGSEEEFCEWLKEPIMAFGNKAPLTLMESIYGIDMVLKELGRIEHGIIS
ncbi:MAG: hypothetical protein A4E57_04475 [Syntrophorhabdaceae bacterium PtaU1.Bin034]|nr:MAG: hypothetical protein A4E57_04475 [Syntrophorhabdaceae bacterium PtaU1.Bin034]